MALVIRLDMEPIVQGFDARRYKRGCQDSVILQKKKKKKTIGPI